MNNATSKRRTILKTAAIAPFAPLSCHSIFANPAHNGPTQNTDISPLPLSDVTLLPSPWQDAEKVNTAYLMALEPDRLLHNYRLQAGLKPKGSIYGGWENSSIAGHTLGHYLTALALCLAQTGSAEARRRIIYIVDELALCQAQDPSGYVAGFTCTQGNKTYPGKVAFEQIRTGHIHSTGFDLNGAWSPLYNWHKLFAGLLDAEYWCNTTKARGIMIRLGAYIEGIFSGLNEEQVQKVLSCEYGGLNESFAELYARTQDQRWLTLSRLLHDRKTLDPLQNGEDNLSNLHANTQIPKVIGLARLYELTTQPEYATASTTFWEAVTNHYSYVIGGNGDREYFTPKDTIAHHVTEQTCETCSSYNMLKLTRMLYTRSPESRFFDYYERTYINHIRAQQNPRTGMFAYMTPLMSGTKRDYSTPFNDFWCCVGTGMESHAKHGDSLYWLHGTDTLAVNLYIPSKAHWRQSNIAFRLETHYPNDGHITFTIDEIQCSSTRLVKFRIPAWSKLVVASLNEETLDSPTIENGYLHINRLWKKGDTLRFTLNMPLRLENPNDNPHLVSVLHGPTVLGADLGPADQNDTRETPAFVGDSILSAITSTDTRTPNADEPAAWKTNGIVSPADVTLTAFYSLHERRSAVYFPNFTPAEWQREQKRFRQSETQNKKLTQHATDIFHPGEMQAERDHSFTSYISNPVIYRGRTGRDARSGGWFMFKLKTRRAPLTLQVTYWGGEINRDFTILVNEKVIAHETLNGAHPDSFFSVRYDIPPERTSSRDHIFVKFVPKQDHTAGPVFGVACLTLPNLPTLLDNTNDSTWP